MGRNLALNIERNGFPLVVYNRDTTKMRHLVEGEGAGKNILGVETLEALVGNLERPRRIILMVSAGAAVDAIINQLMPLLSPGDILIDGGNSYFADTDRRAEQLMLNEIRYIGMGVSGGEEGALWGPSLMPGGQREAWESLAAVLRKVAAKAEDGAPCVAYIGPRGAGHYVKMVHNGIEYADMQLIAEIYDLLRRGLGLSNSELAEVFAEWNQGELRSYLVEITADILRKKDAETGKDMVDVILDEAEQKGTGKWTSQNALDLGAPVPTIHAALEGRILSSFKVRRVEASKHLRGPSNRYQGSREKLIASARDALFASKILAYAQGLELMRIASEAYQYDLQLGEIAGIWRAGCIIRASLLGDIMLAYRRRADLPNLLFDEVFREAIETRQSAMRTVLETSVQLGIPMLAVGASVAYLDSYRSAWLPANLIQAQRDYFGAHTYKRVDKQGVFHTDWT
ncbi:MAG: NADP-dependent phosphogluconate dehydrogenase [Anaerolineae bacterium]|nr:NADP-dependent phosphogluconate dehydrogenase [Anaerolineae bacterium]